MHLTLPIIPPWRRRARRWLIIALIPVAYIWFATSTYLIVFATHDARCYSVGCGYLELGYVWDCMRSAIIRNQPIPWNGLFFYTNCDPLILPRRNGLHFLTLLELLATAIFVLTYWELIRSATLSILKKSPIRSMSDAVDWGVAALAVSFIVGILTPDEYDATAGKIAAALTLSMPFFLKWKRRPRYPVGHCQVCGYNLFGNVSGICPECGSAIAAPGRGGMLPIVPTVPPVGVRH